MRSANARPAEEVRMRPTELMADPHARPSAGDPRHPRITSRWVRVALFEARLAFEDEMERERRRLLDREFDRFWRAERA